MKIIYNNIIPFKGFKAINLFGILFVRNGKKLNDTDINHECIHTAQMKETLYLGFYLLYVIEWIIRLIGCLNTHKAYRCISFEQEAYANQGNAHYLDDREPYSWLWYRYI